MYMSQFCCSTQVIVELVLLINIIGERRALDMNSRLGSLHVVQTANQIFGTTVKAEDKDLAPVKQFQPLKPQEKLQQTILLLFLLLSFEENKA